MSEVEVDSGRALLEVCLLRSTRTTHRCRHCGCPAGLYDSRGRSWRHTEVWGHTTHIRAMVPRVRCREHGVQLVDVPWSRRGARMTLAREAEIRFWLAGGASVRRVAKRFDLPWALAARMKEYPHE